MRPVGIGPTTIGLKGHCSTTELQAQTRIVSYLYRKRSVNPEGRNVARGSARRHILTVGIELHQQPEKIIYLECSACIRALRGIQAGLSSLKSYQGLILG